MYLTSPPINNLQRQVILGTILGGSSIVNPKHGRNCHLIMRGNNPQWLEYKASYLDILAAPNPFHVEKKTGYLRWHSLSVPSVNEFYDLFYENGKREVRMKCLDELRPIGLSVWFMDAGKIKEKILTLRTTPHGAENTETIHKYFMEIDMENTFTEKAITFTILSTHKFIDIISECVPMFMYPRLFGMV